MGIGSIDTNTPTGSSPVSQGDDEIVSIKVDVTESFVNFSNTPVGTDIVTKTGPEIDDGAEKSVDETITGKWSFADRANVENNVSFAGRTTTPSIASFLRINTSNEMEFGEPTSPGVFKNNAMTAEGAWTFESDIRLNNQRFITAENTGAAYVPILGTTSANEVIVGNVAQVHDARFSELQFNQIPQPSSNYCLSVTNGSTTISDGSGGTSGWSVTVLTGTTIRINHALGTAAYVVALGPTDSANKAIVFSKGATDFVLSFDTSNPSPVDVMVMVP